MHLIASDNYKLLLDTEAQVYGVHFFHNSNIRGDVQKLVLQNLIRRIEVVKITHRDVKVEDIQALSDLTSMERLELGEGPEGCDIACDAINWIPNLKSVKEISICKIKARDTDFEFLQKMANLEIVDLNVPGVPDYEISDGLGKNFRNLGKLQYLGIGYIDITPKFFSELKASENSLVALMLRSNHFTASDIVTMVKNFHAISELDAISPLVKIGDLNIPFDRFRFLSIEGKNFKLRLVDGKAAYF